MTTLGHNDTAPLIAVVGFTASGKSALGVELARQFNGEIIAADAVTVYREFNIGSAKPTRKEQLEIQHHMLDVVDADVGFSAAEFQKQAKDLIGEITKRGKLPILVGGAGLYIDSILFDYDFRAPAASEKFRAELNTMDANELVSMAKAKGLNTESVDIYNKRRLVRLIESDGQSTIPKPLRNNTLVLGIDMPKDQLGERVVVRVESMINAGLEAEAKKLSAQYGWSVEPMRSIGYREWRGYFDGQKALDQVKNEIITHTMQLAKKQRTWFKRNSAIHWVNNNSEAVAYTTTFLNK